jgi:imidazoleglycerol-phosphate dehydratase
VVPVTSVTERRKARVVRKTRETEIVVEIELDGGRSVSGADSAVAGDASVIDTPLPFLSHMLDQLRRHGGFGLSVRATGDTHIDGHHTTEDIGIVLGQAVAEALGDKRGIARYGWAVLPMDEARVEVSLDLSGRTYFVWEADIPKAKLGEFDTELAEVFFEAFARGCGCNLHVVKQAGRNLHHVIEITFKAFAKALAQATRIDPRSTDVPSTKGSL